MLAAEPADPASLLGLEGELLEGVGGRGQPGVRVLAGGGVAPDRGGGRGPAAPCRPGAAGRRRCGRWRCARTPCGELGVEPSPALRDAADTSAGPGRPGRRAGPRRPGPRRGGRGDPARGHPPGHPGRGPGDGGHRPPGAGVRRGAGRPAPDRRGLAGQGRGAGRHRRPARPDPRGAGHDASDVAEYPAAFEHLRESVERAERGGDARQQAWSLSLLARAHPLRDERSQAAFALGRSLELVQEQRWIAFLPWPQALEASWSSAPAASPPPASGSSMPTRWPASWATPAGRAWPRVGWGCSGPPWATMPSPRPGRRRRTSAAPGSATATSGAGATSSTPWSPPPSSNTTTPGPGGWPTGWRRWPRAAACASWWSAPTSTAATSATRPPWPPRLLAGSIDNPALARLLDRGPG